MPARKPLTAEQLEKRRAAAREYSRRMRSDPARKDQMARAREADRARAAEKYAAMTLEEKQAYLAKARERARRQYANATPEQKARKSAENKRYREKNREKVNASERRRHAAMTPEQRENYKSRARARARVSYAKKMERKNAAAMVLKSGRAVIARAMPSRELYRLIEAALPRLPKHMRDDAMSEVAILLLDGEIGFDGIESAARRYLNREHTRFGPYSLDALLPGSKSTTWLDMVPADALHF